jgi:hypothetical protein
MGLGVAAETIAQAPALDWDAEALAAQYFPVARSVAWKMHQRCLAGSVDLDELISVASVGLVTALTGTSRIAPSVGSTSPTRPTWAPTSAAA